MKRFTAWLLALFLLLGLTACNGGDSGSSLRDQIGKLPTGAPAGTEPTEPVITVEPTGVTKPGTPGTKQPGTTGDPGATGVEDYSAYEGIYHSVGAAEAEGINSEYLQIRALGDMLLLEYTYLSEGYPISIWVEEFWPDPDVAEDGEYPSVTGMSQTYAPGRNGLPCYWDAAAAKTIVLMDDGVTLIDQDGSAYFERDTTYTGAHRTKDECLALMGGSTGTGSGPVGSWEYRLVPEAACLYFGEDGTFRYVYKREHNPVKMLEGAWVYDGASGEVKCCAEEIGRSSEPYLFNLWFQEANGGLSVWDTSDEALTPLEYVVYFWSIEEAPWSVGYTLEQSGSPIMDCRNAAGVCLDGDGNDLAYSYRVPEFFNSEGSKAIRDINADIFATFDVLADQELERIWNGEVPEYTRISYDFSIYDGIEMLSVCVDSEFNPGIRAVYCYDRQNDTRMYTRELLKRLGISESDFLDTVRSAVEDAFVYSNGGLAEDDPDTYNEALAWTISDDAVNLEMPVYVNAYDQVVVVARIGTMAGAGWYYTELYPFTTAMS